MQVQPALRVVVTGYGPFGSVTDNPSDHVGQEVSAMGVTGGTIEYRRLDVNHDAVDAFVADMQAHPPDVIMSLGFGSTPQLEEQPNNWIGGGREGETHPRGPILPGHAEVLPTDYPIAVVEKALHDFPNRTIGTHLNTTSYFPDRSAYLCDYLNYKLTDAFGGNGNATAGFLHVNRATTREELHEVLQAVVNDHGHSSGSSNPRSTA